MIKTELIGNDLIKTYSDAGVMIHGGVPEAEYVAAIDPVSENRTYVETNIPIPEMDEDAEVEDYENALAELGVE
jgi:hypothetical protein